MAAIPKIKDEVFFNVNEEGIRAVGVTNEAGVFIDVMPEEPPQGADVSEADLAKWLADEIDPTGFSQIEVVKVKNDPLTFRIDDAKTGELLDASE
ncbi:MAG: hypothetical protein KBD55_00415 [Candidatus Pacebacteria bacterium]|nr:hypothetical protein [Candidatus Paceibacterota bacterium]